MQIEIVTIGDELLIGQVVDTNSAWMGQQLSLAGFQVGRITSVSDREDEILAILKEATQRSQVVLLTGGLGPTRDDITKHTLCKFFDTPLVFNPQVFQDIEQFLKSRVSNINSLNHNQAMVPEACSVIRNRMGTAPVMWFNHNDVVVVSMPGVPSEMKLTMQADIIPRLRERFKPGAIVHKTLLVYNIPEAVLAEMLEDWEVRLPSFIKLAYLPSPGRIRLRLTGSGQDATSVRSDIEKEVEVLHTLIGDHIYSEEDLPVADIFARYFGQTGKSLALAESCSGGFLAHLVTSVPGASHYFKGGLVTYSNELKQQLLGVQLSDIDRYGAVSQTVAEQMAIGALKVTGADYAIATTGIAGPAGGSDQKPVGTVWMAWAAADNVVSRVFNFGSQRDRIIIRASETGLIELMQMMKRELI